MAKAISHGGILIVTVTKVEVQAVFVAFSFDKNNESNIITIEEHIYYDLGKWRGVPVYMVQSEMGSATPGGSLLTVSNAIQDLKPRAIIMCGIAYGLRPGDKQKEGDILVSKQLWYFEPQKVDVKNGVIPRGDRTTASENLLRRFRSAVNLWEGAPVHLGLVLSGEKLVNDKDFRDWLLEKEPEAIGGEMEGAGLYTAARDKKIDWILAKAICDWADGTKKDDAQPLAAKNAAELVRFVIERSDWGIDLKKEPGVSNQEISANPRIRELVKEKVAEILKLQGMEILERQIRAALKTTLSGTESTEEMLEKCIATCQLLNIILSLNVALKNTMEELKKKNTAPVQIEAVWKNSVELFCWFLLVTVRDEWLAFNKGKWQPGVNGIQLSIPVRYEEAVDIYLAALTDKPASFSCNSSFTQLQIGDKIDLDLTMTLPQGIESTADKAEYIELLLYREIFPDSRHIKQIGDNQKRELREYFRALPALKKMKYITYKINDQSHLLCRKAIYDALVGDLQTINIITMDIDNKDSILIVGEPELAAQIKLFFDNNPMKGAR